MIDRQNFQEKEYEFPYHHLPVTDEQNWHLGKWWFNGLEYLGVLTYVKNINNDLNPKNVLDFGCGDGRLTLEMKKNGVPKITGIDISEQALNYAKTFNQSSNGNVKLISDFNEIKDMKFDLIVAMEVLEHIEENQLPEIIHNLSKILDENGKFLITVPTLNKKPIPEKHYRHYNLDILNNHVSPFFKIDEAKYIIKIGFLQKLIRRLMINRFFILNWKPLNRFLRKIYEKFVLNAEEKTGANLVAILSKNK